MPLLPPPSLHRILPVTIKRLLMLASTSLGLGLLAISTTTPAAIAAERISARLGPAQRSISVADLDIFLQTGEIPRSLNWYARQFTPEQLVALRQLLQQPFNISAVTIDRFTNLQEGEVLLRRLGTLLEVQDDETGYRALRAALILAAADGEEGLTPVNVIRNYPLSTLRVDLDRVLANLDTAKELLLDDDAAIAYLRDRDRSEVDVDADTDAETTNIPDNPSGNEPATLSRQDFPSEPGPLAWIPATIELSNPLRANGDRPIADLYIPESTDSSAPLIVISHGVASDRTTFGYLARHLASMGFAVAAIDHPDTNAVRFEQYFAGFADRPEPDLFLQRPADITALLDTLEADPAYRDRIRTDRVGLVGQSLGGYTVLASGGAQLNFTSAANACPVSSLAQESDQLPFNLSLLLQCRLLDLPQQDYAIRDDRIAAAIAINPVSDRVRW